MICLRCGRILGSSVPPAKNQRIDLHCICGMKYMKVDGVLVKMAMNKIPTSGKHFVFSWQEIPEGALVVMEQQV